MKVQILSNRLTAIALTAIITVLIATAVHADDTLLISYQGRLTDDGDQPVTGTPAMTFTIYTAGGTSLWSEAHPTVTVTEGLFSVILGSQTALADSVFNGDDRYLGISVDGDDELSPRTLLTSSPGAAYARHLVGNVTTGPGMMVLKNLSGDSAVVLRASASETGITITGMPRTDNSSLIELTTTPVSASIDCFGTVDGFTMAGNLEITSDPDGAGLLMSYGPGPDINLSAKPASNSLLIYPPDSCTPPDPCDPALELIADAEVHSMKIYPLDPCVPPEPCMPALELIADAEVHSMKIYPPNPCASPPCTPATIIAAGPQEVDFDISISLPSDDNVTPISMGTSLASQSSHLIIASPTGDNRPGVEILSTASMATVTVHGEDAAGDPPQIALIAGPDGAKVGIGTDSLVEALTVMGNGWFSGDVFIFTLTRAKRNIEPIDGALDKVSQMNGYYYDCRVDEYPGLRMPEDRQIGFLAEEVNEVVPEAVGENDHGLTGVSYSRITALLVEAVKELKADNEELRSRVEALEGR